MQNLSELRCKKCNKLLAKAIGIVEIKCKCGYYNEFNMLSTEKTHNNILKTSH